MRLIFSSAVESISCTQNGDDPMKRRRTARILSAVILSAVMAVSPLSAFAADVSGADMNNKDSADTASTASAFSDVKTDHWAYDSINTAVKKGWVYGYPDGTFRPDAEVTRAEFVAMLINAMQLSQDTKARLSDGNYYSSATELAGNYRTADGSEMCSDMASSWLAANGYAKLAVRTGIVVNSDYDNGKFGPNVDITRIEIAVMTERAMGRVHNALTGDSKPAFKDASDFPEWSSGYIADSAACGVTAGFPDGTFRPKAKATRAEALAMIDKAISYTEKGETGDINIKAWNHRKDSESDAVEIKMKEPAVIYNGIVYLDALELKEIWNCTVNGLSPDDVLPQECIWNPLSQILWVNGVSERISYMPGSNVAGTISSGRTIYDSEHYQNYDIGADARMLHGRILIPVWNISSSSDMPGSQHGYLENQYNKLTWISDGRCYQVISYDKDSNTVTLDVRPDHDMKNF